MKHTKIQRYVMSALLAVAGLIFSACHPDSTREAANVYDDLDGLWTISSATPTDTGAIKLYFVANGDEHTCQVRNWHDESSYPNLGNGNATYQYSALVEDADTMLRFVYPEGSKSFLYHKMAADTFSMADNGLPFVFKRL